MIKIKTKGSSLVIDYYKYNAKDSCEIGSNPWTNGDHSKPIGKLSKNIITRDGTIVLCLGDKSRKVLSFFRVKNYI